MLDGSANMTIRKVADIFTALGSKIRFSCERAEEYRNYASHISWDVPQYVAKSNLVPREGTELECPANFLGYIAC